jgi:uncharacterized protein YejL (UPF0352 family)
MNLFMTDILSQYQRRRHANIAPSITAFCGSVAPSHISLWIMGNVVTCMTNRSVVSVFGNTPSSATWSVDRSEQKCGFAARGTGESRPMGRRFNPILSKLYNRRISDHLVG